MFAPIVSVIIPVYNSEKYLSECLDSLIRQSFKSFEILAVNDGSTDSSLAILEKYAKRDDRIIVFNQKNKGASSARNRALQEVRGEFVAFVDSDDVVYPEYLTTLFQTAQKQRADLVLFNFNLWFSETSEYKVYSEAHSRHLTKNNLFDLLFSINNSESLGPQGGYIANKFFRYECIKGMCFDERICAAEDEIFCLSVLDRLKRIYYCENCLYHYRQHENSLIHNEQFGINLMATRLIMLTSREKDERAIAAYVQCVITYVGATILDSQTNLERLLIVKEHALRAQHLINEYPNSMIYLSDYFKCWRCLLLCFLINERILLITLLLLKIFRPRTIWNQIKKQL